MWIIALSQKTIKIGSASEHLPVFKALCGYDSEKNAGTIQASNPEHLTVFKVLRGDDLEQESKDNPLVQSGTPCFKGAMREAQRGLKINSIWRGQHLT